MFKTMTLKHKVTFVLILLAVWAITSSCVTPTPQVIYNPGTVIQEPVSENGLVTCEALWSGYRIERCVDVTYKVVCYVGPTSSSCVKY